ncbi:MAG: CvpA family protein [Bacteroidales bacterium]|jgi:membrane protein required for colicin V production|nr:CvpA family protein [Bacteroidales bacterium]
MNWIDFVIIALLAFGLIQGFINGLIIEIAELAALVLGIWGAIHFSGWTAGKLSGWFDMQSSWTGIVAFAVTFIAIVIGVYLLGKLLDTLLKAMALGFVVKSLGAVFGVLKAALILSVIFVFLNSIDEKRHFLPSSTISKSILYNPIADLVPAIFPLVEGGDLIDSFNRPKKQSPGLTI